MKLEQRVIDRTAELESQKQQLQGLSRELIATENRERKRLAAILHDDLQQYLVALKLRLSKPVKPTETEVVASTLDQCLELVNQAIGDLARYSPNRCARHCYCVEIGLVAALRWLASDMGEKHNLKVEVDAEPAEVPLDEEMRAMLFGCVPGTAAEHRQVRRCRSGPCHHTPERTGAAHHGS